MQFTVHQFYIGSKVAWYCQIEFIVIHTVNTW